MRRALFFSRSGRDEKVLEGVEGNGKSAYSDDAWAPAELLYEPPLLEVTQPHGSFCTIQTSFAAALPPDSIFDLLTDPNNHRVFRNIKEVVYRKILEDDGNRQYIELEQIGRWRFLVLSGSFAVRVFLEQKKKEMTLSFDLAKQGGMMRKFTGSWKIEPMRAAQAATMEALPTGLAVVKASRTETAEAEAEAEADADADADGDGEGDDPVVGSWVTFEQVIEPTIKPPWPLSNYIRGIAEKVVKDMLADLQRECQRLSELQKTTPTSSSEPAAPAAAPHQTTEMGTQSGH